MSHPTRAIIHLDRLAHNLRLLSELAGGCPLWPCIKANAHGHGLAIVARELVTLGYDTLCVAHACEGDETASADALAETLGTIHYEVVTAIARREPRIAARGGEPLPAAP